MVIIFFNICQECVNLNVQTDNKYKEVQWDSNCFYVIIRTLL